MAHWYAIGKIVKGDFINKYVAKWDDTQWVIVPAASFDHDIWLGGWKYKDPVWGKGKITGLNELYIISENTVDHYVEIGSQQQGPNGMSMIKGTIIGGVGLGLAAGAASATTISDVAFYMKDGTSFIVHFTNGQGWQELKAALFNLPMSEGGTPDAVQQQPVPPQKSPVEQIKEYKILLDDGIITQEEFDAKKKQLLGL